MDPTPLLAELASDPNPERESEIVRELRGAIRAEGTLGRVGLALSRQTADEALSVEARCRALGILGGVRDIPEVQYETFFRIEAFFLSSDENLLVCALANLGLMPYHLRSPYVFLARVLVERSNSARVAKAARAFLAEMEFQLENRKPA